MITDLLSKRKLVKLFTKNSFVTRKENVFYHLLSKCTNLVLIAPIMKEVLFFLFFNLFTPGLHFFIYHLTMAILANFDIVLLGVLIISPKLCVWLHRKYSKVLTCIFYMQRSIFTHFKTFWRFKQFEHRNIKTQGIIMDGILLDQARGICSWQYY